MAELPRSWERMIKESIGAEEQQMAIKPEGYREIGLGEGLGNIKDAFVQHLRTRWDELSAPIEEGEMSPEALRELAMNFGPGALGGILRKTGTKILAQGARDYLAMARGATDPAMYEQATKVARDVLRTGRKVPQTFWDPVKEVSWDPTLGKNAGTQLADAWPWQKSAEEISTIKFNPRTADATTVWHELAHARQFKPRGGMVPYRGAEMTEQEAAEYIAQSSSLLKTGLSAQEYSKKYYGSDPLETSAEAFARLMVKGKGADPEAAYNLVMGRALEGFEGRLPKEAQQAYFRFVSRSD